MKIICLEIIWNINVCLMWMVIWNINLSSLFVYMEYFKFYYVKCIEGY